MNALQDLGFATRTLRAHPGTALFATLTLALGLGAVLALQAVIDAVLLRDLAYPDPARIVVLGELAADGHRMDLGFPNYADLVADGSFSDAGFRASGEVPLASGKRIRRATVSWVGGDFFRVLASAPERGRTFGADEHQPVAVISHALWQSLLEGRADVVGQSVTVDGEQATIIGVMPEHFAYPPGTAAWLPFREDPGSSRTAHNWSGLARLAGGTGLGQARLAAANLAGRLVREHGEGVDLVGFDVVPLAEAIAAPVRKALLLLGAGTLFLLLIAVTNATNLLLALNGSRSRELAVRAALGASSARLARQVFAEAALIAAAAGTLGLALAWAALRVLVHGRGAGLPRAGEIGLSPGTALAALALVGGIALVTTLAVLASNRRRASMDELRESGRGQSASRSQLRLRAGLLVGQTALTTVLLVGVGLLGRSFLTLLAVDPGFNADSALSVRLAQGFSRDPAIAAGNARRYQRLMDDLRAIPGVSAVGGVNALPLAGGSNGAFWDGSVVNLEHPPRPIGYAEFRVASPGYFEASGIPLLAGRAFDDRDASDGLQVALISAAAARATWGSEDPLGKRIQYGNMDGDAHVLTIVGVVGDVAEHRLDRPPMGTVYVDLAQRPVAAADFSVVVRSALPLATLMPSVRQLLERAAADIPHEIAPLAELRADALAGRRFSLGLLGAFAGVALVLAIGGLYGLMAFAVGQRRHEFALRQALGATRRQIAARVVGSGLAIGGLGIGAGIVLALAGARLIAQLLYGVRPADPLTLAAVVSVLTATLLAACALPARRACRTAPREALS